MTTPPDGPPVDMGEVGPACKACGRPTSLERGIMVTGDLNEAGVDYYCEPCAPNRGKGYTLADLQRMRDENRAAHARYKINQMEQLGPDVYFAVAPALPVAEDGMPG